jgi:hypothetical protein
VELSRALARRGHNVLHLHFADFQAHKYKLRRRPDCPLCCGGRAAPCYRLRRAAVPAPALWEAKIGALIARAALLSAPRLLSAAICRWTRSGSCRRPTSTVVSPHLATRLGLLGRTIGRLEGCLLRASDAVVAIPEKFPAPLEACAFRAAAFASFPTGRPSHLPNAQGRRLGAGTAAPAQTRRITQGIRPESGASPLLSMLRHR